MPSTTFNPFQPTYTPGQEQKYLDDLYKTTSSYAQFVNSSHSVDDMGRDTSNLPTFTGYTPTTTSHYTPEQAVALYNKMDPALANDPEMMNQILRAQAYFKEGQFAVGAPTATADTLKSAQDQWKIDKAAQDHNSDLFGKVVGAVILGGAGAVLGGATGLIGNGAGVGAAGDAAMTSELGANAFGAYGTGYAADATTTALGGSFLTDVTAGEIPASFGYGGTVVPDTVTGTIGTVAADTAPYVFNPAVDSQLASTQLGLTAADVAGGTTAAGALGSTPVDAGSLANLVDGQAVTTSTLGSIPVDAGSLANVVDGQAVTTGNGFFGNAIDSVSAWTKANPGLTAILGSVLSGIGSAYGATNAANIANQGKVDVANIQAKSALDVVAANNDNKIAQQNRLSDSITGMKAPGLINSHPLMRLNGTPVFNPQTGLINRG